MHRAVNKAEGPSSLFDAPAGIECRKVESHVQIASAEERFVAARNVHRPSGHLHGHCRDAARILVHAVLSGTSRCSPTHVDEPMLRSNGSKPS
jgi:hypothetical protein